MFRRSDRCVVCGHKSKNLRTIYVGRTGTSAKGYIELYDGYFKPRLTIDEKYTISCAGRGELKICANRTSCRQRQRKQAIEELKRTGQ